MSLDPATRGFARTADAYERGRPDYPDAAVDWLCSELAITPASTVVDLAAGTGKLTRRLAARAHVIAVEPIAEMRVKLEALLPDVRAVEGTAEALPLKTNSADAVTVGQAFHWFDGDKALAEIHRALRPGGGLGLVWNRRDLSHPIHAALQNLLEEREARRLRRAASGGARRSSAPHCSPRSCSASSSTRRWSTPPGWSTGSSRRASSARSRTTSAGRSWSGCAPSSRRASASTCRTRTGVHVFRAL